jgi:hypothetical protein
MGSGSHEADSPFQIVAMQKEVEASSMHQRRFGERECFANKSGYGVERTFSANFLRSV